ncbi:undecaprenyl-phosphate mannosyltransferase [bacterium BMS3Bbin06]|nr:undecaprenyl-phosphate mannosyltransferase [bacterium BMS3Bbin06]
MKLVIQIPCYNEEKTIGLTISKLPREIDGISKVELLIVDDGSTDRTVEVAKSCGVDYIVRHPRNLGLAKTFMTGLEASIEVGADIIVNTDADNQYCADDIEKLINPILNGTAEIVVGARPIDEIDHFSPSKKCLQKLGSWVVRLISRTDIDDVTSGFRAISRKAAMHLNIFDSFTYTLETVIQAGQEGIAIISVPVGVNEEMRPSRLIKNVPHYIMRSLLTVVRIFMTYKAFRFFSLPGVIIIGLGLLISIRFMVFYLTGDGIGHIQSLILSALLMGAGGGLCVVGLLADLISVNRKMIERINWRMYRIEDHLRDKE